jgi:hypothetical protein
LGRFMHEGDFSLPFRVASASDCLADLYFAPLR